MRDYPEAAQAVFDRYREKYLKIFGGLYPSKNSTGFSERNLSVNYSKAVEEIFPSAYTWFEFQFGDRNNLHFDAVVIIPEIKTLLVVEAKRFSDTGSKIREIGEDIVRIKRVKTEGAKEFTGRFDDYPLYAVYGVILADVWTETEPKKEICASFANKSFLKDYKKKLGTDIPCCPEYFIIGFDNATGSKSINENYYLLAVNWKVK